MVPVDTRPPRVVTVFGSLNTDLTVRVDRFPQPGETLQGSELVTAPGGKSANQAVAAATLGSRVRLIGAVGDDAHGRFLLSEAETAGVDVSGVTQDPDHATGSAMIVVDVDGENTIIVSAGANGRHTARSVHDADFGQPAVVCLCLEVPMPAVQAAAEAGKAAGATVLLNLSPYADVPATLPAAVDVLVVNGHEAELFLGAREDARAQGIAGSTAAGSTDWDSRLNAFIQRGVERVVVTLGPDGAVVLDATAYTEVGGDDGRISMIGAPRVEAVDTTGCGDAFMGALAHRLAEGSSLVEAARLAVEVGALAATRKGAQTSYPAFGHLAATQGSD